VVSAKWAKVAKAKIDGRPVIVSVSGGKDSTAVCLLLMEHGIDFQAVHMDTGWEHPATEAYVRDFLPGVIGPIRILETEGMVALVKRKGMFPSRQRRFCTQELKVKPLKGFFSEVQESGLDPINTIGIRRDESQARATAEEWGFSELLDAEVWRPLVDWSFEDVIAVHQRHGVRPNQLYLEGASRVGCWPCINSRKAEIRFVLESDPGRIDLIRGLEEELGAASAERHRARGEAPPENPTTFFQAKTGKNPETGKRDGRGWPIDRVVAWSKTQRGGKLPLAAEQLELFASESEGCARWGFCDTRGEA